MDDKQYTLDRRPITSRDRALSKRVAHWLVERGASPNAISLAGMLAALAAGAALAVTSLPHVPRLAFVAAAVLMQLRLLANMFDGMVAVEAGRASPVGELYNEVPDRVSDAAVLIGAGYAAGSSPVLGYLAACGAIFVAYVRAQGKAIGADQEFCGPMAKPQRMFLLTVLALYCAAAPTSWQPEALFPPGWGLMAWGLCVVLGGEVWTSLRRLRRIARALRKAQS
ncbi:CDP-alcohol phosphatidyltransferase family protein [bacterium]|nr:CDP-alcohol phosphatidyltransferase family protein [bacterium]